MQITEEFRWWKKQILRKHSESNWLTIGDFIEAIESLCSSKSKWVRKKSPGYEGYIKSNYELYTTEPECWRLWQMKPLKEISKISLPSYAAEKAQNWADGEIERYETFCPECGVARKYETSES